MNKLNEGSKVPRQDVYADDYSMHFQSHKTPLLFKKRIIFQSQIGFRAFCYTKFHHTFTDS